MSFIQNESTDSNEIEFQFNNGIKMIVNAYETQTNFLSNEVKKLSKEIEEKSNKINELQNLCQKLLNQKNSYENNIKNLSTENEKLKEQLNNILIENNELKRVKQNILATIENTNNNNSIQIKHNTKTLEQIYKNNSYKILN
jgi:DNA repair ATPase RecN